jgi:hypothetical protein
MPFLGKIPYRNGFNAGENATGEHLGTRRLESLKRMIKA